eukprot:3826309-Pyramimonas_sp.AAC.1
MRCSLHSGRPPNIGRRKVFLIRRVQPAASGCFLRACCPRLGHESSMGPWQRASGTASDGEGSGGEAAA